MASSRSTKAPYDEFYAQFQSSRTALVARIELSKSRNQTNDIPDLSVEVAKLRKSLVDGTSLLPAYDRKQCETQMTMLEGMLEEFRSSSTTKLKFAFKRKTQKPAAQSDNPQTQTLGSQARTSTELSSAPPTSDPSMFRTLSSHSHKYLKLTSLPPPPPSEAGPSQTDLTIADMRSCIIDLCSSSTSSNSNEPFFFTALHIRDITDSVLVLPPVRGSVLLHNITRSVVAFRMHTSTGVQIFVSIPSNPIIEHCSEIAFAPYPPFLSSTVLKLADNLSPISKHTSVQDFSHIRPTPSPNWSILEDPAFDWESVIKNAETNVEGTLSRHLPWNIT
ncbi:tubulin binding cofactor C-domain-containing protein [Amylostereum chailletii]|nr:tubulin binding cofactor C-domain-containing protein [Amylostereum chailletii]